MLLATGKAKKWPLGCDYLRFRKIIQDKSNSGERSNFSGGRGGWLG